MSAKEKLLAEIETLPDHRIAEVLDYIHFLQYQERLLSTSQTTSGTLADADPLHQFVGGIAHGQLAQNIDEEIYVGMGLQCVP